MKLRDSILAVAVCAFLIPASCFAGPLKVLSFEGLTDSVGAELPRNYGGFSWGASAQHPETSLWRYQPSTSMPNAASSGAWFVAFVGRGLNEGHSLRRVGVNSGTPFDLMSVYLTGAEVQRDSITIEGFAEVDSLMPTFIMTLTPDSTPTRYELDFLNIRRVLFTPIRGGRHEYRLGMDDFAFYGNPTEVKLPNVLPEPSSLVLLLVAFLTFAATCKNRVANEIKLLLRNERKHSWDGF